MLTFKQYMIQEKTNRDEAEKKRLGARKETEARQQAEAQIRRVPPCVGATPHAVREWIREVQLTIPYSHWTIHIAAHSAKGALRREIEFFLSRQHKKKTLSLGTK